VLPLAAILAGTKKISLSELVKRRLEAILFYVGKAFTPTEMEREEASMVSAFIRLYLSVVTKHVKHSRQPM